MNEPSFQTKSEFVQKTWANIGRIGIIGDESAFGANNRLIFLSFFFFRFEVSL